MSALPGSAVSSKNSASTLPPEPGAAFLKAVTRPCSVGMSSSCVVFVGIMTGAPLGEPANWSHNVIGQLFMKRNSRPLGAVICVGGNAGALRSASVG